MAPKKEGRITEVAFRANVILAEFRSAHVEATSTVGEDESPAQALARCKQVVGNALREAKGRADRTRPYADEPATWRDDDIPF